MKPGDRVRLTGAFLRNTGQYTGPETRRVWTVQECACGLCARGEHVAVNDPGVGRHERRHIAVGNLILASAPDHS